jgi:HK97 family phage major capsid protein
MGATAIEDSYADLQAKIDEAIRTQQSVVGDARSQGRDLTDAEAELVRNKTEQIKGYRSQAAPLIDQITVANDSRARSEELSQALALVRRPDMGKFSYRSAGHYVLDNVRAVRGDREAAERIDWYNRTAAHQTTTNAAGIVPQEVVAPVINFIDSARPLVSALGARTLEGGPNFFRPRVTTHTSVAKQTAEKAEFVSQAMVIDKLTATVDTYGGYVNVSRQIIDWSSPSIMDIIVGDLATQYAKQTEAAAASQFTTAATAGTVIPTGAASADAIAAAVWAAVGAIYTAIPVAGRIVGVASPAMLGVIGPAFAPVNPANAQSTGFTAADFGSGLMGSIGGVPIYVSPGLTGSQLLVIHPGAAEVYDQTIGMLSVVEPSVGGVQVAYMGYFSALTVAAGGIIKITKTP